MYCVYGYRCSDAPFSAFMDECILYGMGGHKKQGSERGSTDRERGWKPRRALNQVELILRPFSLVKIILFFFHFRCVICYERRQRAFIVPLAVERVFRVLIVENIDPRWSPCCWFRQGLSKIEVTLLFCPLPDPFSWICESLSAYSL